MNVLNRLPLTIVAYHYVRDMQDTRYPRIKGRTIGEFVDQIKYIMKNYNVCSEDQVIAAVQGADSLPENPCWLTFDDGLIDHFDNVLPILRKQGLSASFYPPVEAITENKVLDVHKIHFILASAVDIDDLIKVIFEMIAEYRKDYDIPDDETLYERNTLKGYRFDPPEVLFVKQLLQRGIVQPVRQGLLDKLFCRYVSPDPAAFSREIYMNVDQLRFMRRCGMAIGGHGHRHVRLAGLAASNQEQEIKKTYQFLSEIHHKEPANWVMAYPYGSYNEMTIKLLKRYGCIVGLTAILGVVTDLSNSWQLSRLDTNDIPLSTSDTRTLNAV